MVLCCYVLIASNAIHLGTTSIIIACQNLTVKEFSCCHRLQHAILVSLDDCVLVDCGKVDLPLLPGLFLQHDLRIKLVLLQLVAHGSGLAKLWKEALSLILYVRLPHGLRL